MKDRLLTILKKYDVSDEIVLNIMSDEDIDGLFENSDFMVDFAVKTRLEMYQAKNTACCMALLDKKNIKVDGGEILGVDDEIKRIKRENPYLFEEKKAYNPYLGKGFRDPMQMTDSEYFNFKKMTKNGGM